LFIVNLLLLDSTNQQFREFIMSLHKRLLFPLFSLLVVLAFAGPLFAQGLKRRTDLDRYIAKPDDSYEWKVVSSSSADGMTTVVVDMISQTWRTAEEVDRPVWQHWLTVSIPDDPKSETGLLWIGGGRNGREPPSGNDERFETLARLTGSVVAELHMIPNQPLVFHKDGHQRSEDDLIGYTWDQYLKTGDASWPARNPMVKSAVRAMDTLTALTSTEAGGSDSVESFVVAGGSKRGWTTWLTGAVDKRVVAIMPIVIDVLNVREFTNHHFGAYGFWAPSIGNYVEHRIMEQANHPRMQSLYELVDPYYYRHRLTMPKFIINASGDQFFLPDSSQFYFDQLRGQKNLRYVPNADHSLRGSDAMESITAFYSLILNGRATPSFSWEHERGGFVRVKVKDKPTEVRLWQATNPHARDFRMESLGPKFTSEVLEPDTDGEYTADISEPVKGFTAYFVELTYDIGGPLPLKLTSDVRVIPDVLPFKKKDPLKSSTITARAVAPDEATIARLRSALGTKQITDVAESIQIFTGATGESPSELTIHINWKPVGRFRPGLEAFAGLLTILKCEDISYWFESGPRVE
jgi:PhoPQ-activated pathogenicity-related protein